MIMDQNPFVLKMCRSSLYNRKKIDVLGQIFIVLGSGVIAYIFGWRRDFLKPSSYKISNFHATILRMENGKINLNDSPI